MMRCPRCPNGAVIASNADPASSSSSRPTPGATQAANQTSRPSSGPYVDLTLTMQQMPAELQCRVCGWKRDADGMSITNTAEAPFADQSTKFELLSLADVPLHPGLEASGRNDDLIQRLMHFPRGVLCTSCGGPSERVEESVVKSAISSFKNLPQPPNDIESRASWWGFQSNNFSGRPVILEWYFVVTRAVESNNVTDDMVDLCIGCGRCCLAKYAPVRQVDESKANKTAPLDPDWADKQREREREYRRRNPLRKKAERGDDGLPVPGTGGIINSDGEVEGEDNGEYDGDDGNDNEERTGEDSADEVRRLVDDNSVDNRALEENRIDMNNTHMNNRNNNLLNSGDAAMPLGHDHTTGAHRAPRLMTNINNRNNNNNNNNNDAAGDNNANSNIVTPVNPTAVVADPQAVKEATAARAIAVQQVRILEEARKHIVTLLENVLGAPSTWPRNQAAFDKKNYYKEIWTIGALVWVLASGSPTKTGAMLEWSLARDFLIKRFFKTQEARNVLDAILPRDPRDPDILLWSEKCTGPHARAGALIFARRLHECFPLEISEDLMWALRDAVSVANRTRALRILSSNRGGAPIVVSADAAAAASSSSTGDNKTSGDIVSASTTFSDSRNVRFPIGWISPHSWKSMQARSFRFALFILRQAELDGKTNPKTVYLVSVRLMLRFMSDATTLTEGSVFSLLCGLDYNDVDSREYVVLDFRNQDQMKLPMQMAVDRLMRISRGANWEPPNPNWSKSLMYVTENPLNNSVVRPLIQKLSDPGSISVLKIVACHEDVNAMKSS